MDVYKSEVSMTELIRKWQQNLNSDRVQHCELYDDKLITDVKYGLKREDKLTYFLNNEVYPRNLDLSDIFDVFNRAIHLPSSNSSERTLRIIEFYKAFTNQKIEESEITLSQEIGSHENILYVTKFGIYQNTCNFNRSEDPCYKSNLQLPHDFFFYGPRVPNLSFEFRSELKKNILKSLNITSKNKDIIGNGFKLFDYDKIKELNFYFEQGNECKYLKTYNKMGKVVYGGWSNPRDGGEQSFSLESLYYKSDSLYIDEVFKDNINEIKEMLEITQHIRSPISDFSFSEQKSRDQETSQLSP